tara:strand:- start:3627 stop:4472 length:846 start_codon:yes stop_codon:yes gene_type:complete
MSWSEMKTGNAVKKESSLELAKNEVKNRIKTLQERHRANLCTLIYGEAKTGKSGVALDTRTKEEIKNGTILMVLDFDNGSEPTWRANWDSDPTIEILNPIVRDEDGYPDLNKTIELAEAFIVIAKERTSAGQHVKFIFDGVDRWLRLCFLVMTEDKRSTQAKFLPILWGNRNKVYEDLMEKITDGLDCDRFFITHMKEVYEGINNPTPTGKVPNLRSSTMDKMNEVIEISRKDIGKKSVYTARVQDSKRQPAIVNKEFNFLTIENGKVKWSSIKDLQEGTL